jgi:hypothetical protein
LGGQDEEFEAAPLAFFFEDGYELRAAVDHCAWDFEGAVSTILSRRAFGPYEQHIDLDEFAGNFGFSAFWQAPGIALLCGVTEARACGFAAQERNGLDRAACGKPDENAPDCRDGEGQSPHAWAARRSCICPTWDKTARLFHALSLEVCVVRLARQIRLPFCRPAIDVSFNDASDPAYWGGHGHAPVAQMRFERKETMPGWLHAITPCAIDGLGKHTFARRRRRASRGLGASEMIR